MKYSKVLSKFWLFFKKNYYIPVFFICIILVGIVSLYKLFFSNPTYVYVKVKINNGPWPAWLIKNLKKGDIQKKPNGQMEVQILGVTYYPSYNTYAPYSPSGPFDVYLSLKLRVDKMKDKYSFYRSVISVNAPIDLEFPNSQFNSTIISLSTRPLIERYENRTIYLTKRFAYSWEYDAIKVGDKYFDGQQNVFEILDKNYSYTNDLIATQYRITPNHLIESNNRRDIIVKARVRVEKFGDQLVFGEEQTLSMGKAFNITTNSFTSTDSVISKIE